MWRTARGAAPVLVVLLTCCLAAPASATSEEVQSATAWLVGQQRADHGWGAHTSKAVIALTLANATSHLTPTEHELILKQLQINFLVDMLAKKEIPLTTGRIAEYVLAFVGLCFDVTQFYGRDLTAVLRHHGALLNYETAFVVLATCAAGGTPHRRTFAKLVDVTRDPGKLHGTDTLAISVLALRCVQDNTFMKVQRHLETPVQTLVQRQQPDGSFGNFHSTLLAVQALRAAGEPGWNDTAAMQFLLTHRQPDGSFGNLFDTTQVLPVLAGRSLADIGQTHCRSRTPLEGAAAGHTSGHASGPTVATPATAAPVATSVPTPAAPPINFTLWLWIGKPPNTTHSIELTVPKNTSAFEGLKLAAERDPNYEFSATVWPNGHYIHTIGGVKEEKVGYMFWLLYRLTEAPDVAAPPPNTKLAPVGSDFLYPENGDHILFWYKKI